MRSLLASRYRAVHVVALLSTALIQACAGGPDPFTRTSGDWRSPVQVTIQNNEFRDAAVYAVWSGSTRRRVGMVTGKTTQTFTIEWRSDVVRFEVDFIAGGTLMVEPIDVSGGDHLELVIMQQD